MHRILPKSVIQRKDTALMTGRGEDGGHLR